MLRREECYGRQTAGDVRSGTGFTDQLALITPSHTLTFIDLKHGDGYIIQWKKVGHKLHRQR